MASAASWLVPSGPFDPGMSGKRSGMTVPPECERSDHRGQFGPDVVHCDQELRLNSKGAKEVSEAAATAIPRLPAIVPGFAFTGHGLGVPCDQQFQCIGWDDATTAYTVGAQSAGRNVIVDGRATKA